MTRAKITPAGSAQANASQTRPDGRPCLRVSRSTSQMPSPSPATASSPNQRTASGPTLTMTGLTEIDTPPRSDRDQLHLHVAHLGIQPLGLDEVEHLIEHLVRVAAILADAHDAQRRYLPRILRVDLGNRDVEAGAYALGDRLDDHAF